MRLRNARSIRLEHVFGNLLGVVETFHFPCEVRQLPPAGHPRELAGVGVPTGKDIFQAEAVTQSNCKVLTPCLRYWKKTIQEPDGE